MAFQIFKQFKNSEYGDGILIEEYNGTFYLAAARKGRNHGSTVIKRWAYPQTKDRVPSNRALPWQIRLGDSREEAIESLSYFVNQLKT